MEELRADDARECGTTRRRLWRKTQNSLPIPGIYPPQSSVNMSFMVSETHLLSPAVNMMFSNKTPRCCRLSFGIGEIKVQFGRQVSDYIMEKSYRYRHCVVSTNSYLNPNSVISPR